MNGLIPSYFLNGDIGAKIGRVKGMPMAWSSPTILSSILENPSCLFIYDEILIDLLSYEHYYDSISEEKRPILKSLIESKKLNLFKTINIEEKITASNNYEFEIEQQFKNLTQDSKFLSLVKNISQKWGNYATPSPLKFEAMNIPLIETIRDSIENEKGEKIQIIDHFLRAPLYGLSWEKNLSKYLAPEIAQSIIEFTPKIFNIFPYSKTLDIDQIAEYRGNEYLTSFKKKVNNLSLEYGKTLVTKLKNMNLPDQYDESGIMPDKIFEIEKELQNIQLAIYNEISDAYNEFKPNVKANKWSILGGILSTGSPFLPTGHPTISIGLGVLGGVIILTEQLTNKFKQRKYSWVEFIQSISEKEKRKRLIRK
ncbi:MAG: hypothetical protein V1775_06740 [Bacteroidota bacterium]